MAAVVGTYLGGGGGSATIPENILELVVSPGSIVAPDRYVNAVGRQWLNATAAPITVPAVINAANMQAAGLDDVTSGLALPSARVVTASGAIT